MIRWIPNPRSVEYAQGESLLVWLMNYARWYKAQWPYTKQRFAKGVQRNINWAHFMVIIFFTVLRLVVCLVLFSYIWCKPRLVTMSKLDSLNLHSRIKKKKKKRQENAHKSAKSLKARKVSRLFPSSWLWKLSFCAIWRSLRKLDDFTLRGERQHLNTLISMDIIPNSTHTQSVDYLRVKRPGSDAELSRAEPNSN